MFKKILNNSEEHLCVNGGQYMFNKQKDLQIINDYIKGELSLEEQTKIIARLNNEPELREIYNPLNLLKHTLPELKEPYVPYKYTINELLRNNNLIP